MQHAIEAPSQTGQSLVNMFFELQYQIVKQAL